MLQFHISRRRKKLGIGVIIQNKNGEFLLHLRGEHPVKMLNQWCLIGGAVEEKETPEQAAEREIEEETGLTAVNLTKFNRAPVGLSLFSTL